MIRMQQDFSKEKVKEVLRNLTYLIGDENRILDMNWVMVRMPFDDKIIEFIRVAAFECGISGYNEKKHSGDLRHIVISFAHATIPIITPIATGISIGIFISSTA